MADGPPGPLGIVLLPLASLEARYRAVGRFQLRYLQVFWHKITNIDAAVGTKAQIDATRYLKVRRALGVCAKYAAVC
jgi:hypothetical protein